MGKTYNEEDPELGSSMDIEEGLDSEGSEEEEGFEEVKLEAFKNEVFLCIYNLYLINKEMSQSVFTLHKTVDEMVKGVKLKTAVPTAPAATAPVVPAAQSVQTSATGIPMWMIITGSVSFLIMAFVLITILIT